MIEHVESGRRIYVWPDAINPDGIASIQRRAECLFPNRYLTDDGGALARAVGGEIKPHMVGAPPFRWSHEIVLAVQRRPVPWHYDIDYQNPWKVLVYLSSLGGVEFRSGLIVGGRVGDVVMFDTGLEHRAQPFVTGPGNPKKILGLRAHHEAA